MRSITLKLMLSFLVVSLTALILVFALVMQSTNREVREYYIDQSKDNISSAFIDYYEEQGSWIGIENKIERVIGKEFDNQGLKNETPMFFLLDERGEIIYPVSGHMMRMSMSDRDMQAAMSLVSNGQNIGTMVFMSRNFNWQERQPTFLVRINRLILIITSAAILLSLVMGALFSRNLSKPIRELTAATKAAAAGDLSQQVTVRSKDELGELAESFNAMNAELNRLITARRQMTADIAHELRTPISIILGNADGVRDGVLPLTRETFDVIVEEAERLESLVEDLHTLSRAEAGELPMTFSTVSVSELIDSMHLLQYQAALQKDIQIVVDIPQDLPVILADPDRIVQVLRNILNNAVRYTPQNGRISLSASQSNAKMVQIRISDSGPGVSLDELGRIFDRFYRADTSRQRDTEGSGLGLAIAKSIVERHGGRIWAENNPNQGLSVVMELPFA